MREQTEPAEVPDAPPDFVQTSGAFNSIGVSWGTPEENGAPITGYILRLNTGGDEWDVVVYGEMINEKTMTTNHSFHIVILIYKS